MRISIYYKFYILYTIRISKRHILYRKNIWILFRHCTGKFNLWIANGHMKLYMNVTENLFYPSLHNISLLEENVLKLHTTISQHYIEHHLII